MLVYLDTLKTQIKPLARLLLVVYSLLLVLFVAIAFIATQYGIPVGNFTRDPLVVSWAPPYTGVVSNLGMLFWSFAVASSFVGLAVLSKLANAKEGVGEAKKFFLYSALLTLMLLLDDLFMFHDVVLPEYAGIRERYVYLFILACIGSYFLRFVFFILKTEFLLLGMASGFLALSLVADVILPQEGMQFLYEDGFKLTGIVTWFIYYLKTATAQILRFTQG